MRLAALLALTINDNSYIRNLNAVEAKQWVAQTH